MVGSINESSSETLARGCFWKFDMKAPEPVSFVVYFRLLGLNNIKLTLVCVKRSCYREKMECGSRLVLLDFLLVTMSLVTHLLDLLVNCHTVYKQFYMRNYAIVALIVLLFFIPGFITSILSCFWLTKGSSQSVRPKLPTIFHVFRILSIVFLNSPVSGYGK